VITLRYWTALFRDRQKLTICISPLVPMKQRGEMTKGIKLEVLKDGEYLKGTEERRKKISIEIIM